MTVAPGLVRAGLIAVVLALTGACLFGIWHVVVGGVVNGNPRAGTFGLALASVTGALLLATATFVRRSGRDG